jgi:hypothetical protein
MEMIVASNVERDYVFAEFYYQGIFWAELSVDETTGKGKLEIFQNEKFTMPYEEVIEALQSGYARIQPRTLQAQSPDTGEQ